MPHTLQFKFQSVIAKNIQSEITEKLQKSSFASVMADESTDIAVSKKLVIYAKLISDCIIPETHFLTNITIEEELCTLSDLQVSKYKSEIKEENMQGAIRH